MAVASVIWHRYVLERLEDQLVLRSLENFADLDVDAAEALGKLHVIRAQKGLAVNENVENRLRHDVVGLLRFGELEHQVRLVSGLDRGWKNGKQKSDPIASESAELRRNEIRIRAEGCI